LSGRLEANNRELLSTGRVGNVGGVPMPSSPGPELLLRARHS